MQTREQEHDGSPRADHISDTEVLAGGRWASENEDYSEQLRAAEYIQEEFDFEAEYQYTAEEFAPPNRLPVATVRGFWLRGTETKDVDFCVSLELDDGDTYTVVFRLRGQGSAGSTYLRGFLQTLGIGSDSVENILGRKVYYTRCGDSDLRDGGSTGIALRLYNMYRTYLSVRAQSVGMKSMFFGVLLGLVATVGEVAYLTLIAAMGLFIVLGIGLMVLPLVRERFPQQEVAIVKHDQFE